MSKIIKNFQSPIHLACAKDVYRPTLNNVFFEEGYVWATDGHLLVRQSLESVHGLDEFEIDMLNGKSIHRSTFDMIRKFPFIKIKEDCIESFLGQEKISFHYSTEVQEKINYKEAIMSATKDREPISSIGLNVDLLAIAKKILDPHAGQVKLHFTKQNKAIFISCSSMFFDMKKNFALLMPVMVSDLDNNNLNDLV